MRIIETFEVAAGVNPQTAGYEGRIVLPNGASTTGRSSGLCVLSGVAGAVRPLGVCVHAENADAGLVSVVIFGDAELYFGGVVLPGAVIGSDLAGEGVEIANGAGVFHTGVCMTENGLATAATGMSKVFVNPGFTAAS